MTESTSNPARAPSPVAAATTSEARDIGDHGLTGATGQEAPPTPTTLIEIAQAELAAAHAVACEPSAPVTAAHIHLLRAWSTFRLSRGQDLSRPLSAWLADDDALPLRPSRRRRAVALLDALESANRNARILSRRALLAHCRQLRRLLAAIHDDLYGWSLPRQRQLQWLRRGFLGICATALLIAWAWTWCSASRPGRWRGAYYPHDDFTGVPVLRNDGNIGFNWGRNSPMEELRPDYFSVRWDTCLRIEQPTKAAFQLISNNDSRLFVDSELAVDNWNNLGDRTRGGWYYLTAGMHHLRVEYREGRRQASIWFLASLDGRPPDHIPRPLLSYPQGDINDPAPCRASSDNATR